MAEPAVPCPIFPPYHLWDPYAEYFPENRYALAYLQGFSAGCEPFSMTRLGSWYIRAIAPSWNNPQKDFNVATHHLESMLNWSFLQGISLSDWTDEQFMEYLRFRLCPPANWIGAKACPRFVESSLLPFSEWEPNQRWRPYQLKLDSTKGATPASVLHMIRRNYNWAAGFFHFCNRHSWTWAPKGNSFTVVEVAASMTSALDQDSLSDHEMQWVFNHVAEARPKGLNPREVMMYMAFARYAKMSIDEVTETPEAAGGLAYFVKNGRRRWEWCQPGSLSPSLELSSEFGQYFEDYLLFLGIDASQPLPQHPLFPQRRRPSVGLSAFRLATHLAGFRSLLGDAANRSPDPLISGSEAKFRRINFAMIRRNPML
ncbi:hypothetical protein SAMN03159376_01839 [Pseudomonas sp. NFACC09-4]|uniref:hypothetical protein n=1 Tax=Pseudomonas TaxID=286 RepID=UPI000908A639|nr:MULTISPECIES: hypothetical protein [Pseudomonas]NHN68241.1 hypothetical protein [Pseudomonas fluorescens]SFW48872.1 hypothetical protein SAMN03159376_01839 [Pseudomonas sp. NFACC09-4]